MHSTSTLQALGRLRIAFAILTATAAALTAGCGGGGDSAAPAPSPAPVAGSIKLVSGTLDLSGTTQQDQDLFARISGGTGIAADAAGNLFHVSSGMVVKRTPAGDVSPITATPLIGPTGIALDSTGAVLVTQRGAEQFGPSYQVNVLRIDTQGRVTPVPTTFGSIWPAAIAAGADASFYVSGVGSLRKVLPDGAFVNVTAPEVRRTIDSIAVDAAGNVYFGHDNMVRKIVPGQAETLLAGSPTAGSADGAGDQARFRFGGNTNVLNPLFQTSLAVDSTGNVYVADNGNHTIRKITPAGVVTTVAGQAGVAGLEVGPLPGKLSAPRGLALQGDKTLYVTSAGAVLKIELP